MMEAEKGEEGSDGEVPHFATWIATRRRFAVDSAFFAAGNVERELLAKQISLEITEEEKIHIGRLEEEQLWQVFCPIAGCGAKLKGLGDLEAHYLSRHTATCSVCTRVFPTTRLLNLHVSESHDSFFQAKVARNYPMYECLVEGCSARFLSDPSRHQHLVDRHHFPRSFRFHAKKHASQKQRHRQKAHHTANPGSASKQSKKKLGTKAPSGESKVTADVGPRASSDASEAQAPETAGASHQDLHMDVDEITTAVSRLSTVSRHDDNAPSLHSFGHRRGRGLAFVPGESTRGSGRGRGRSRGRGTPPSSAHPS